MPPKPIFLKYISRFTLFQRCSSYCVSFFGSGDFSSNDSRFWGTWGSPSLEMVTGTGGQGDSAIKATKRMGTYWSPSQNIKINCLKEDDMFVFQAKYKLEDQNGVSILSLLLLRICLVYYSMRIFNCGTTSDVRIVSCIFHKLSGAFCMSSR